MLKQKPGDQQAPSHKITLRSQADGLEIHFSAPPCADVHVIVPWDTVSKHVGHSLTTLWALPDPNMPTPEALAQLGALTHSALVESIVQARHAQGTLTMPPVVEIDIDDNVSRTPSRLYQKAIRQDAQQGDLQDLEALQEMEALADEAIDANDTRRALEIVQNVMADYRKLGKTLGVARCTIRGAELLMEGERYHETAFNWLKKGLEIYQQNASSNMDPHSDLWKGRAYLGLARLCSFDDRLDEAWTIVTEALQETRDAPSFMRGSLFLHKARFALQLNLPAESLEFYQKATQHLRNSPARNILSEAHSELGQVLTDNGDHVGAQVHLSAALRLAYENNDVDLIVHLSTTLAELAVFSDEHQQAWSYVYQALPHAKAHQDSVHNQSLLLKLLELATSGHIDQDTFEPIIVLGKQMMAEGQCDWSTRSIAIVHLIELGTSVTDDTALMEELVGSLSQLKLPQEPLDERSHATLLRLSKHSIRAGQWLESNDSLELARRAYRYVSEFANITKDTAQSIEAFCGMGRCEASLGMTTHAMKSFDLALACAQMLRDFNPAHIYTERAQLHRMDGEVEKAHADTREALSLCVQNGDTSEQIANLLIEFAALSLDRAEMAFAEQTLKQPQKAFDVSVRGAILLASEEFRTALAEADRSLREANERLPNSSNTPLYLMSIGRINMLHGDTEAAIEPFEFASRLAQNTNSPLLIDCICRLAESQAYLRKIEDAYQSINTAHHFASTVGGPLEQTLYLRAAGRVAFILGEHSQATTILTQAVTAARNLGHPYLNRVMHLEANLLIVLRQAVDFN